ncbi:hypothetical protein GCM10009117_01200 [Gangjinia marincola]|uniref:HTH cro/C1-type domain-containing protein n=1 Tax=Gangjinia marincola TaxID=578463 RepID=A0ABP3XQA5_9FLAO
MEKSQKSITTRLKKLRENYQFSQKEIAHKLDITQGAYSLIEKGQNSLTTERLMQLCKIYDVTPDHILISENNFVRLNTTNGFVPLIKVDARAGFIENRDNYTWLETQEMFKIPGFEPAEGQMLFEVEGDSMMPTLLNGDILITQENTNLSNILDGSIVVVVTEDAVYTKRLKKDLNNDAVILISDNSKYDNQTMTVNKIQRILVVRGKITSSLNVVDLDSNIRVRKLESEVDHLKNRLNEVIKKIDQL